MELSVKGPKIWVYPEAVDFRRGIDGLSAYVYEQAGVNLREDIFVFHNRHRNKLKLLAYHGNGFVLLQKRLEQGHFHFQVMKDCYDIDGRTLSWLLAGLDWPLMQNWSTLSYDDFY